MPTVVIVGVNHEASQFEGGAHAVAFGCELHLLCDVHRIVAIAEEASDDALASHGVPGTVGAAVARSRSLAHLACDPGVEERKRLGLDCNQADIYMRHFFKGGIGWKDRAAAELQAQLRAREREWLEQLQALAADPILFVCGAEHADPFAALLREHGCVVVIAHRRWPADEEKHSWTP